MCISGVEQVYKGFSNEYWVSVVVGSNSYSITWLGEGWYSLVAILITQFGKAASHVLCCV